MSRTAPTVVASHTEGDRVHEVCDADAVYAVLYLGRPIKLRTHRPGDKWFGFKYGKSMFPEPGHAIRLANKLNLVHGTDEFTVAVMTVGRTVKLA